MLRIAGNFKLGGEYVPGDVVLVGEEAYRCVKENTGASYTDDSCWHKMSEALTECAMLAAGLMEEKAGKLPNVTKKDNGKILKVVGGKWVASAEE